MVIDSPVADWPAVAVSGSHVYVANDIVTAAAPYNTEIFFLQSSDNGFTWSTHQQITFATGRSETKPSLHKALTCSCRGMITATANGDFHQALYRLRSDMGT